MRYVPTDNQIAYLKEIGVPTFMDRELRASTPPPAPTPRKKLALPSPKPVSHSSARRDVDPADEFATLLSITRRWVVKLLTPKPVRTIRLDLPQLLKTAWHRVRHELKGLGLLLIFSLVPLTAYADDRTMQDSDGRTAELPPLVLELQPNACDEIGVQTRREVRALKDALEKLSAVAATQHATVSALNETVQTNQADFTTTLTSLRMSLVALQDQVEALATTQQFASRVQFMWYRECSQARAAEEMRTQRWGNLLMSAIVGGGALVLLVIWHYENRLRQTAVGPAAQTRIRPRDSEARLRSIPSSPATIAPVSNHARVFAVPSPTELRSRIIAAARKLSRIKFKPSAPARIPWNLGLASSRGPVRARNEDYALALEIAGHQIIVVADGVGGLPFGQEAAYCAVRAAAWHIVATLGSCGSHTPLESVMVAEGAIRQAARRLAQVVSRRGGGWSAGFRTTLLAIVASKRAVGYCYIGDGGGCVLRTTGQIERFLLPQKADPAVPNVLAASLGPTMQGRPISGSLSRLPGDLLVCGTDGVMDRLSEDYPLRLRDAAYRLDGNLQEVADRLIAEMSAAQDELGHICDDNLTVVLVGDVSAPQSERDQTDNSASKWGQLAIEGVSQS